MRWRWPRRRWLGTPQPLTLFVANRGTPAGASAGSRDPAAPAGIDTSSEFAMILLDWVNTGYAEQLSARDHAIKLLKTFQPRQKLDEGMRLALEDLSASYTLGFHAPEDAATGLHEIRLRVNRPGVTLRYRETYRLVR